MIIKISILALLLSINTLYSQNSENYQRILYNGFFNQDFYNETVKEQENGYYITSFDKCAGQFNVVLSKKKNISVQNVEKLKNSDLKNENLKGINDQGGYVSDMTNFMGWWYIVLTGGRTGISQKLISAEEFPENELKKWRKDNYYITSLDYDIFENNWKVILSKGVGINDQRWTISSEFPADKIEEDLKDGYFISSLKHEKIGNSYGENTWVLVSSKKAYPPTQTWKKWDKSSLNEEIYKYWDNGYVITQMVKEEDFYYVIMTSELVGF